MLDPGLEWFKSID